jgi:ligand-binding SRPBCC domain-containing protein
MPVMVHASLVRAPLEKVYAFHTDTRNLEAIQPPGFHITSLEMPDQVLPGSEIRLVNSCFGLSQEWWVKIEAMQPPHGTPRRACVIDLVLKGPFPYFRHRHEFVEEARGTLLTDVVDFEAPGGVLRWLLVPGVWLAFKGVFAYRHVATRWRLEQARIA